MYSLPKGPSKIVASARRGPPRQLDIEGYDTRDKLNKSLRSPGDSPGDQIIEMSIPKPTFQQKKLLIRARPLSQYNEDPALHENHLEMGRLLRKQWRKVEECIGKSRDGELCYEMYREKEANQLEFEAFDLEKFWGKQALKNALGSSPS